MQTSTIEAVKSTPSKQKSWMMFDRIAGRYDLLNHLLSFGQDILWRRTVTNALPQGPIQKILDIATGTGDQLIAMMKRVSPESVGIGVDMSSEMLAIGAKKIRHRNTLKRTILIRADGQCIPVASNSIDVLTITFGIRNFENTEAGLREMYRVLRPGGTALILEFSLPTNVLFKNVYLFYFRNILPLIGSFVSGDGYAYRYLNNTVETFPYGQDFCRIIKNVGFSKIDTTELNLGIATIYRAAK